jgi:hypothetical protein
METHTPQAITLDNLYDLKAGDIVIDLHKRANAPKSSWSYTLVSYEPDRSRLAYVRDYSHSWSAIYGRGKSGGMATQLSNRRLLKLHFLGNLEQMPFKTNFKLTDVSA